MTAYYNEIDPYAAQWLRNLIAADLIASGEVDERSILDVRADDLKSFTQCHFFAGIGGWSHALRLAGWPDERPVWTGSCPCQPFSAAGKRKGFDDDRHLWPAFRFLISERRPATVFGEQVASATEWLGLVRSDLENLDYAVGAIPIEAASAGADHKRDRFWFVANRESWATGPSNSLCARQSYAGDGGNVGFSNGNGRQAGQSTGPATRHRDSTVPTGSGDLAIAERPNQRRHASNPRSPASAGSGEARSADGNTADRPREGGGYEWVFGTDGKARRVKSGVRLLAHDVPDRVAKLRAFGNAIVPQVAAEFIAAYAECEP